MLSISGAGVQLEAAGRELAARALDLEAVFLDMKRAILDVERLESGGEGAAEGVWNAEIIAAIRRDANYVSRFIVRGAETAENKNAFSASRILVKEQWRDCDAEPGDCILTARAVASSIEKIGRIHVNVFPRDVDGLFVVPPKSRRADQELRRVLRRLLCDVPCQRGDSQERGESRLFSRRHAGPEDVRERLCKDPLYDYRGELNAGTFIGDYSGKVERKTAVKWTGEKRKFTLASTSEVIDGASRAEAVQDYMDFMVAVANALPLPQRLSRHRRRSSFATA